MILYCLQIFVCITFQLNVATGIPGFENAFIFLYEINQLCAENYVDEWPHLKETPYLKISEIQANIDIKNRKFPFVYNSVAEKLPFIKFNTGVLIYFTGCHDVSTQPQWASEIFLASLRPANERKVENFLPTTINYIRETYVIILNLKRAQLNINIKRRKTFAIFSLQNVGNISVDIHVYSACIESVTSRIISWSMLTKYHLDTIYPDQFGKCYQIVFRVYTQSKEVFISKSEEVAMDDTMSSRDKLNINLLQTMLPDYLAPKNQTVTVRVERILLPRLTKAEITFYTFAVDEYVFNFLSCDGTRLKEPYARYTEVFTALPWCLLILVLAILSLLFAIILRLQKRKQNISDTLMITLGFFLEQYHVPAYLMRQRGFTTFLVFIHIFALLVTNSYRGKLAMHFTTPPLRIKIPHLTETLTRGYKVLGIMDSYAMSNLQTKLLSLGNETNTTRADWIFKIYAMYRQTSRFILAIDSIYNSAVDLKTKQRYKRIIESLTHPFIENANINETVEDLLLKCSKTVLAGQSQVLDQTFLRLQSNAIIPNLYRGREEVMRTLRIWVFEEVWRDRNGLVYKRMQSLIHSGIFQYKTWLNEKWKNDKEMERIAEASEEFDFVNDSKYFVVFYAYGFFILICVIFAILENLVW